MTTKYTGHLPNSGGLQGHSIGGTYPIGIYARETDEGTRYGVMNFATGHVYSVSHATARDASAQARNLNAIRNAQTTIRNITRAGGHRA